MRALWLPVMGVLMLGACEQQIEPATVEAETPPTLIEDVDTAQPMTPATPEAADPVLTNVAQTKTATIDWNAARADFAARDTDDDMMAQVASGGSPVVPVLLPEEPVGVASVGEDA